MTKVKWGLVFICLLVIGATLMSAVSATTSSNDITVNSLVQLTTGKANDLYPTWSPDGKKIAYCSSGNIWVMNSNGSNQKQLTTGKRVWHSSSWSPNGKKIAFVSGRFGDYEIWVMDRDGNNLKQLTTERSVYAVHSSLSWSLDGKKIAFVAGPWHSGGKYDIWVMDSDGSNQKQLTPDKSFDGFPAWSPDGKGIAFASDRFGGWNIWVMDSDGSNQKQLTTDRAYWPSWSPDGKKIAFVSGRSGVLGDIWVMDSAGSNQKRLTTDKRVGGNPPSWSLDGKKIAFCTHYYEHSDYEHSDIWVMNSDGSNQKRLTTEKLGYNPPSWPYNPPSWSPDGKKIAFTSSRSGGWNIWVVASDEEYVIYVMQYAISSAQSAINDANNVSADTSHAQQLFEKAQEAQALGQYQDAINFSKQAEERATQAKYIQPIISAQSAINAANNIGADTSHAQRLLQKAQIAYENNQFQDVITFAKQAEDSANLAKTTRLIRYIPLILSVLVVIISVVIIRATRPEMSDIGNALIGLFLVCVIYIFLFFTILPLIMPDRVHTLEEVNPIFQNLYQLDHYYSGDWFLQQDKCFYFSIVLSAVTIILLSAIGSFIQHYSKTTFTINDDLNDVKLTERPTGVTILAIWHWIAGIICLLFIAVCIIFQFQIPDSWGSFEGFMMVIFIYAIICFVIGCGLLGLHRRVRMVALVTWMLFGPIGAIIVWYLSKPEVKAAFQPIPLRPETRRYPTTDKTLDIYTPTLKQLDNVTPISNIEEIGKYAECPYCGSNIRETFYELGGIVRCDKCGAFHHKECFEYYGKKCGSSSCKLRDA